MCHAIIEFNYTDGRNADTVKVSNQEALEEYLDKLRDDTRVQTIKVFKLTNTYERRVIWDETPPTIE